MSLVLEATELSRHFTKSAGLFKRERISALNEVSLSLKAGTTLAVVGESGSGKTTLAKLLALLDQPSAGQLKLLGIDPYKASRAERQALRAKVQMVFQNPYASLNPRLSIGTQLQEPLKLNTALTSAERMAQVNAMLEQVGLKPEHRLRYAHEFSGGQRQRIAIARAMMLKPALLIADEPTAALDVSIQAQILNLFKDLQEQYGTAMVFISHNLPVVRYIADEVLVMYRGYPVERGASSALFTSPRHPYTQTLLAATPTLDAPLTPLPPQAIQTRVQNSGCNFAPRCPKVTAICTAQVPKLRPHDTQWVACHNL